MNIKLHIGISKTGSTLLQFFCLKNWYRLIENGILFPKTGFSKSPDGRKARSSGHYFLIPALKNNNYEIFKSLEKEISEINNIKTLLVSSENFSLHPEIIQKLKKYFSNIGNCNILVYIRRQDFFIESIYSEFISGGWRKLSIGTEEFIENFLKEKIDIICDYKKMIEPWEKTFGKENIKIRPFEQNQWKNRDLIQDFFHTGNLTWCDDYQYPEEIFKNISASAQINKTIRYMNKVPLNGELYRSLLSNLFESDLKNNYSKSKSFFLSPLQRTEIISHYRLSNSYIAKNYFERNDGRLFYDKEPEIKENWQPVKIIDPDLVALIFSSFLEKKSVEIDSNFSEYKKNLSNMMNSINGQNNEIEKLKYIKEGTTNSIEKMLNNLNDLNIFRAKTEQIFDNHEKIFEKLDAFNSGIFKTFNNQNERIEELNSLCCDLLNSIGSYKKSIGELNSFCSGTLETLKKNDLSITELKRDVSILADKISENTDFLIEQNTLNSNLLRTIEQNKSTLSDLENLKANVSAFIKKSDTIDTIINENDFKIERTRGELLKMSKILRKNILTNYYYSRKNPWKCIYRFMRYYGRSEYNILLKAGLVDVNFYYHKYPDTIKGGLSAVKHYVRYGVFEGRNPSEEFNTLEYLIYNPDAVYRGYNPLVHYYLKL